MRRTRILAVKPTEVVWINVAEGVSDGPSRWDRTSDSRTLVLYLSVLEIQTAVQTHNLQRTTMLTPTSTQSQLHLKAAHSAIPCSIINPLSRYKTDESLRQFRVHGANKWNYLSDVFVLTCTPRYVQYTNHHSTTALFQATITIPSTS